VTPADVPASMEAAGVARFKLPEHLVVVDELPTSKIDKKALREDLTARLAAEDPDVAAALEAGVGETR
jgi:non-ribosomal peptide synthetase component E (peptide arylation enzyme)